MNQELAQGSHHSVCILGAPLDGSPRGVRALGASVAELVRRTDPSSELVFLYPNDKGGTRQLGSPAAPIEIRVQNCRLSPKSAPSEHLLFILFAALLHRVGIRGPARKNAWLRSLLEAKATLDISGGDRFSDIYGAKSFVTGSLPLVSAALLKAPFALLPQTYGPFSSLVARRLAKYLLRRARVLLTRDHRSEAVVQKLVGRSPEFCPDVAFALNAVEPSSLELTPSGLALDRGGLLVGINVNGRAYLDRAPSAHRELIDALVVRLLESTDAKVLLIPHEFGAEREVEAGRAILEGVAARFPGRVFALEKPLNEREVKWVIGRTHVFIGASMHACIAALSQLVPTLALASTDKFLGVLEGAGLKEATVDLRATETAAVLERALSLVAGRAEVGKRLAQQIPDVQAQVARAIGALVA